MSDEVHLSPEATAVADRIRSIDRRLDEIERRVREFTAMTMRAEGSIIGATGRLSWRDRQDAEHQHLLDERADLVAQLKRLDGDA
jgi:hypothetical protein